MRLSAPPAHESLLRNTTTESCYPVCFSENPQSEIRNPQSAIKKGGEPEGPPPETTEAETAYLEGVAQSELHLARPGQTIGQLAESRLIKQTSGAIKGVGGGIEPD